VGFRDQVLGYKLVYKGRVSLVVVYRQQVYSLLDGLYSIRECTAGRVGTLSVASSRFYESTIRVWRTKA